MVASKAPKKVKRVSAEQVLNAKRAEWDEWRDDLLAAIPKGYIDNMLPDLLIAMRERVHAIAGTVDPFDQRTKTNEPPFSSARPYLNVGDTFCANDTVYPRYMRGRKFQVIKRLPKNYRVKLIDLTGIESTRFARSVQITMPPQFIDQSTIERKK